MIRKWFGEEPAPWNPKCRIILYANADHYARDTGKPAASPGHTTMKTEGERVVDRRIDLHCDVANLLTIVLPHETTHAVLSGRFGRHVVPRWVDEGIAVLTEPRDQIDRYLKNLPTYRYKRELFAVSQLMAMNDYPEPRQISPFYVQSISLVEYLSSQKGGPEEFTRFVRDGLEKGYEAAHQAALWLSRLQRSRTTLVAPCLPRCLRHSLAVRSSTLRTAFTRIPTAQAACGLVLSAQAASGFLAPIRASFLTVGFDVQCPWRNARSWRCVIPLRENW